MDEEFSPSMVAYKWDSFIVLAPCFEKSPGTNYQGLETTIFQSTIDDDTLAASLRRVLSMSKPLDISYEEIRANWREFITKCGFKSEKAFIQKSKRVGISHLSNKIIFTPFKAKLSDKVYFRIPDFVTQIPFNSNSKTFCDSLKSCWENCLLIK